LRDKTLTRRKKPRYHGTAAGLSASRRLRIRLPIVG
jgi:hypothetical protein